MYVVDCSDELRSKITVCVAGLPVSYDKLVVVHEGEPPAHVHTAAGKLWMAALLHKEVWFYCCGGGGDGAGGGGGGMSFSH